MKKLCKKFCYINSKDPRIFVPGREKTGVTLNLGHPTSYLIIIGAIIGYIVGGLYFDSKLGPGAGLVFTLVYSVCLGCLFFVLMKVDAWLHPGLEVSDTYCSFDTEIVKHEKEK